MGMGGRKRGRAPPWGASEVGCSGHESAPGSGHGTRHANSRQAPITIPCSKIGPLIPLGPRGAGMPPEPPVMTTDPDIRPGSEHRGASERSVPVEQLVDLERLRGDGRPPTPKAIRSALPAGWVLNSDGTTARRDLRVLARDGWVLVIGLISFGAVGLGLFWSTFPKGWRGIGRFAALIALVLVAGGLVAPLITRALTRRSSAGPTRPDRTVPAGDKESLEPRE